jgi:hypothetical protein
LLVSSSSYSFNSTTAASELHTAFPWSTLDQWCATVNLRRKLLWHTPIGKMFRTLLAISHRMYGQLGRGSGSCRPNYHSHLRNAWCAFHQRGRVSCCCHRGFIHIEKVEKTASNSPRPCRVPLPSPVKLAACGSVHTAAISVGADGSSSHPMQLPSSNSA